MLKVTSSTTVTREIWDVAVIGKLYLSATNSYHSIVFSPSHSLIVIHYKLSPLLPNPFIQFSVSAAFWFECFTIDEIFFDFSLAYTEQKKNGIVRHRREG